MSKQRELYQGPVDKVQGMPFFQIKFPNDLRQCLGLLVCLCLTGLYSVFLSTIGFEITDTGYNITQQYLFNLGEQQFDLMWISEWVGGAWLKITNGFGLFGISLGWVLLNLMFVSTLYLLFLSTVGVALSVIISTLIALILVGGRLEILYYTNISALLVFFSVLIFLSYIYNPSKLKYLSYVILAGLTFGSRFPSFVVFICFPFILLCVQFLFRIQPRKIDLRYVLNLFIGNVLGVLLFLAFTFLFGYWESYVYSLKFLIGLVEGVPVQEEHSVFILLNLYISHFLWRWHWAVLFLLLIIINLKLKTKFQSTLLYLTFIVFNLSMAIYFGADLVLNNFRAALGSFAIVLSLFSMLVVFWMKFKNRISQIDGFYLLLVQMTLLAGAFATIVGSSAGFLNLHLGLWLLLPIQLYYLIFFVFKDEDTKRSQFSSITGMTLLAILIPMSIKSVYLVVNSPYRDVQSVSLLTTEINDPKLMNIKTTSSRAKSVRDFLVEAKSRTKRGETVLAYNNIPFVYYLTNTIPYLENSWPSIQGEKSVRYYLNRKEFEPLPRIIFRAITNTQSMNWGNGHQIPPHSIVTEGGLKELDKWVVKNGYKQIWGNSDFIILEKNLK